MSLPDFSSEPLIDREQFDMLVMTGEDEAASMLDELLTLFVSEAEPKFIEMAEAAGEVDRHRGSRLAHALAGASANLGLLRLSKLCRAYEHGAKDGLSAEDLASGTDQIKALYAISIDAMKAEIAKL